MTRRPTALVVVALVAAGACISGGGVVSPASPSQTQSAATATPAAARPERCRVVQPGELGTALGTAAGGDALCLADGVHPGPITIDRPVTVWGTRRAIIRSHGLGTTIRITAPGASLLGVTVDGSGGSYDEQDAAVAIRANGATVAGLTITGAVFGILADRCSELRIIGNDVTGRAEAAMGLRGDGIRLWEVRRSTVAENHLRRSRDLVVWYSPGNRIERNVVTDSRYGTHFMHSHDNVVDGNRYERNVVGVFVMYSRGIAVRDNLFLDAFGGAGLGLGVKDSGNITVVDNTFVRNTTAVYLDNSPVAVDERNRIEGNAFRLGRRGLVFHGPTRGNEIRANTFSGSSEHVAVEGGGDALAATWSSNHFDDYVGYDLDGDGTGDVPYELRSLSNELASTRTATEYFRGTAAFAVVDALGKLVPLFAPRTVVRDERPAMAETRSAEEAP